MQRDVGVGARRQVAGVDDEHLALADHDRRVAVGEVVGRVGVADRVDAGASSRTWRSRVLTVSARTSAAASSAATHGRRGLRASLRSEVMSVLRSRRRAGSCHGRAALARASRLPCRVASDASPDRSECTHHTSAAAAPWPLASSRGSTTPRRVCSCCAVGDASPWREHFDEYNGGAGGFHERHYNEFVSFLPYVQRFLYGEGRAQRGSGDPTTGSPMRVFRRRDIAAGARRAAARRRRRSRCRSCTSTVLLLRRRHRAAQRRGGGRRPAAAAGAGAAVPLRPRLPRGWDAQGQAVHCLAGVEWLDANGAVLARSDAQQGDAFLAHLAEHRAPRISAHWEYVLAPLVNHHSAASRRAALSPDRVLPHADDGLPRGRRARGC